ncbi:MAG: methionine adenosyltransferase [Christensenellaceae bacterium]|jgi:S-adenosylmethionine synthetase|nr:methionine adenosyltransferase [Christensenellaceae bacterium]
MAGEKIIFTSESVTEGHPDKLCDQIADAILDAHLRQDPTARVACEVCATTGMVLIMGEISSKATVDHAALAREVIEKIGYCGGASGFDAARCAVLVALDRQSPDIAQGVDSAMETRALGGHDTGAGDQGMMFGYAADETPELMPLPIALSHRLTRRLAQLRKSGELPFLRPDGKAQVSVEYDGGKPARIEAIVVSTQHGEEVSQEELQSAILERVIRPVIPSGLLDEATRYFINPTGRFVVGGPEGDSGLTGRKLIVDTYGGFARHGGGSFSGKDPTKVDRSGSYMARYIAKNIVAAGLAKRCELQIAYAIGVAQPVSVLAESFGTGLLSDEQLVELVRKAFDLRPAAIIERLKLRATRYLPVAAYGHFGRDDLDLPWERTDAAPELRRLAGA